MKQWRVVTTYIGSPRPWFEVALLMLALLVGAGCAPDSADTGDERRVEEQTSALVSACNARNVAGFTYSGSVCGGSVIDSCSPGAIYKCTGGARSTTNNCTLAQSCAVGCLTGTNSTPVTLNTSTPSANDACFTGPAPLTISTTTTTGGDYVTMTATLNEGHSPYAIVNLEGTGPLVPPLCDVPLFLMAGVNTVSFVEPTGVVTTPTTVPLWVLISYTDAATGRGRNLVSVPSSLTLNPGGTLAVPPLLSFKVTDGAGATISTIPGGSNAFTQGTLSASTPAPVGGAKVTVTSNPASAFVSDGSFVINPGCTTNSTSGVLTATSSLTSNLAATVSATTGAAGATPLTQNVVVTPPPPKIQSLTLTPATVSGGASLTATVTLNRAVDANSTVSVRVSEGIPSNAQVAKFAGCTGTPACSGPLTVPAGASSASVTISTSAVTAQQLVTVSASAVWSNSSASAQLTINPGGATATGLSSLVMSPSSGTCGFSSTGTVTLTGAAPAGGAAVTLSSSSASNAQVPASVTVAQGQTQATFPATTGPTCSLSSAVITAAYGGVSQQSALFFNAATACTPTTCAAQGKNCGTIADGCGGTLTCGTCTSPQTCGGGGVPNVCSSGTASATQLTLSATGRSGESVSSSPTGLKVTVGTTGSASFATGTSVTLTVSNGRDAVWSGGCSSGGAKQKSCSLTLNAATSVTANVQ